MLGKPHKIREKRPFCSPKEYNVSVDKHDERKAFPMNIILQMNLFKEDMFENLGDLERLQPVLYAMDDAEPIHKLYRIRGKGRND